MNKIKQLLRNFDHEYINIKFINLKYYFLLHLILYLLFSVINYYPYDTYYRQLDNNSFIIILNIFFVSSVIIGISSFTFIYVYVYLINKDDEFRIYAIMENNLDEINHTLQKQKELVTLISSIYIVFTIIYSSCYIFQVF